MVDHPGVKENMYIEVAKKASFLYERIKQLSILLYLDDVKKEGKRADITREIQAASEYKEEILNQADFDSDIFIIAKSLVKQLELGCEYLFAYEYKEVNVHLQNANVLKESLIDSAIRRLEWQMI